MAIFIHSAMSAYHNMHKFIKMTSAPLYKPLIMFKLEIMKSLNATDAHDSLVSGHATTVSRYHSHLDHYDYDHSDYRQQFKR